MLLAAAQLCASATARDYSVEDLLRTEDFGRVMFDPQGRWLVFEQLASFNDMERFDMLPRANILRSRLYRVDLQKSWQAKPLLTDHRPGVVLYGFSTGGSHLAVGRFAQGRWQLGIVTMEASDVRWHDLSPDYSPFYNTVNWLSDDRLAVIALPGRDRPAWLMADSLPADRLPGRWEATRTGKGAAVSVFGSGSFSSANAKPTSKRLVMLNARTGALEDIAKGPFLSMTLAPDRQHLALTIMGAVSRLPQGRPISQIDGPFEQSLAIFDVQKRVLQQACLQCVMLGAPVWSPGGDRLAFFARDRGKDWSSAALYTVSTDDRPARRMHDGNFKPVVTEQPDGSARAAFAWRGSELLLFGRQFPAGQRDDWYLLKTADLPKALTASLASAGPVIRAFANCENAMTIADGNWCLDGKQPVRKVAGKTSIPSSSSTRAPSRLGKERAASSQGKLRAIRTMDDRGVTSLRLVDTERSVNLATANSHLCNVRPAQVTRLDDPMPDGSVLRHWLYLPPENAAGQALPLVVVPYPGRSYTDQPPSDQQPGTARFQASAQILAAKGYAVLLPSLPQNDKDDVATAGIGAKVDRAVDAALATGLIDPSRIALWGHSHGAYAVAMIVSASRRYASAIAAAGIYDQGTAPGTFGPSLRLAPEWGISIGAQFAWAETGQGAADSPPWDNPDKYIARSPLYRAGRINTPMLIIAADRDSSPLQQSEQLFSSLFRQDKDAELLIYWGEGHVIGSPANLRDLYVRVFNWLETTMPERKAPRRDVASSTAAARPAPSAP